MGTIRAKLVTRGAIVSLALITAVACSGDDESTTSGMAGNGGTANTTQNGSGTSSDTGGSSSGGSGTATTGPGTGGSAGPSVTSSGGNAGNAGTVGPGTTDVGGSGGDTAQTSGGGSSGAGGSPANLPASCETPAWDAADFEAVYDVGPDQDYATPSDVPWETLAPGSLVRIHWREAPYTDKWVVSVAANEAAPVVVLGVPDDGRLPRIVGAGATTREELDYWSGARGILKIGGSSVPDSATAEHVFVECLDLSGARPGNGFTNSDGESEDYSDNASAIFLESGSHIVLRNNILHDSGNGLFIAHESSDIVVSGNQLFDNGNPGSAYEHNSYTEARGITFEFNRYGVLCEGCDGNNLKDRSSGLVVRYNWIEGGNRALDLVDSEYDDINGASDYDDSFVYGNVLIEFDGGNRQIVHYGGDNSTEFFRSGTLHFYHNTVVSERPGLATVVRLSSSDASIDARNNIFFVQEGSELGFLEDGGTAMLSGNWLSEGWQSGSPSLTGTVTAMDNVEGSDPGFADAPGHDFQLDSDAEAAGIVVPLAATASNHPIRAEYAVSGGIPRGSANNAGAFE